LPRKKPFGAFYLPQKLAAESVQSFPTIRQPEALLCFVIPNTQSPNLVNIPLKTVLRSFESV
jgi:hypothetical protein